jgi:hypothetical protein
MGYHTLLFLIWFVHFHFSQQRSKAISWQNKVDHFRRYILLYVYHKTQVAGDIKHCILDKCQKKMSHNFIPSHLIDYDIQARH